MAVNQRSAAWPAVETNEGIKFMDSKKLTKKKAAKKHGKKTVGEVVTSMSEKLTAAAMAKAEGADGEGIKKAGKNAAAKKGGKKNGQPDQPPEGAYTLEGPIKDTAGPRFLFSIPSQHTGDNDYEHLVIAKSAEQACNLLADARITEKQPHLSENPTARASLLKIATQNYLSRKPTQIEPRKDPIGVLQINHHKLGVNSPELSS
jgi:hypothetical protein